MNIRKSLLGLMLVGIVSVGASAQSKKITDLPADTAPTSDDLTITVNDPSGTAANKKVTLANLFFAFAPWSYCADAGSTDAYACSLSPAPAAYVTGNIYRVKVNTANTGAATINLNSIGAVAIKKAVGGVTTDLVTGDIRANQIVVMSYDGTNMQMLSASGAELTGDVTSVGGSVTTIANSAVTTAKIASKSGNGTTVGTTSGSTSNGKCLEWDANGNIVTAASNAACGSGSGSSYAGVTTGGTGSLDMAQGTKTANEPWIDATGTWNSSGVTFEGITLNATDNASAAGSLLLNLKRSDSTVFSVGKSGAISIPTSGSTVSIAQNGSYGFQSGATLTSSQAGGASSNTLLFSSTYAPAITNYTAGSGSTNNPDFGTGNHLYRITPNAAGSTLTGGRDINQTGELHRIANVGSALLTLANNNSASSAGRRWLSASNLDLQIAPNQMATYFYDGTSANLRVGKFETSETFNVTTQFDKAANTTLGDVTGLSTSVQASRTYHFRAVLFVDADATGGYKVAIGGTATATAIVYNIKALNNGSSAYTITSRQTALAGSAGAATGTSLFIEIEGTITVNAAGTLTVQFAQNASNGTSSVLVGSTFDVNNIN